MEKILELCTSDVKTYVTLTGREKKFHPPKLRELAESKTLDAASGQGVPLIRGA